MIIFGSEALSLTGATSTSSSSTSSEEPSLEAMPALIHKSSSEMRGGVILTGAAATCSLPLAAAEPFVVRLGVGPRWYS